jgi:hypothetical protein
MKKDSFIKRIILYCFAAFIIAMIMAFVIAPKHTVSKSERRHLAKKPELTIEGVLNESFMEKTEEYLLDHFPFRDGLRRIKAYFAYGILQQKQNNDIYVAKGHASKLEYPLKESSVKRLADKMTTLRAMYFPDSMVFYCAIPDKNMFLAKDLGYPYIEYSDIGNKLNEYINDENFINIDLISDLTVDDYYRTDTHWKQENLFKTAKKISDILGVGGFTNLSKDNYSYNEISDFYGVYYGQSALPMEPDEIIYLTNDIINSAHVWNIEDNINGGVVIMADDTNAVLKPVYQLDKLEGDLSFDKYDIFLGGSSSLEIIESPKARTDRRLVIFRDSYTSSLAPLLLEAYGEITLIDLRYISSDLIGDYVDFSNADIMFLYGVSVINGASGLK